MQFFSKACNIGDHKSCSGKVLPDHSAFCACICHSIGYTVTGTSSGDSSTMEKTPPTWNMEEPDKPLCCFCGDKEFLMNPDAVAVKWWKCVQCGKTRREIVKSEVW